MWGGNDEKDSHRALMASIEQGITTIDTAPVYGFGKSEELVGNAVKGIRDKIQILTKFGLSWEGEKGEFFFSTQLNDGTPANIHRYAGKENIIRECEDSLKRLQTDYIDLYQIHWPDPTTPIEESMEAVDQLIRQGKVRAAGVSNYNAEEMKKAGSVLTLASNQVSYSMVKRDIEEETVPYCIENNVGILVYSPLQRGILGGKIQPDHRFRRGDNRPETPYYKLGNIIRTNEFLDKIRPIAENRKISLSQLVLRWTLQQPGITCLLAGVRNEEQLLENAGTLQFELSQEEINEINENLENLELSIED
jgi:aryl-alcohol dehydrogenase-like predicted oxidoreductase